MISLGCRCCYSAIIAPIAFGSEKAQEFGLVCEIKRELVFGSKTAASGDKMLAVAR